MNLLFKEIIKFLESHKTEWLKKSKIFKKLYLFCNFSFLSSSHNDWKFSSCEYSKTRVNNNSYWGHTFNATHQCQFSKPSTFTQIYQALVDKYHWFTFKIGKSAISLSPQDIVLKDSSPELIKWCCIVDIISFVINTHYYIDVILMNIHLRPKYIIVVLFEASIVSIDFVFNLPLC